MDCLRDNFYDGLILDGRFQTVSPLNHGSFGMVFLANDLLTGENVAIKCLTKKSAAKDVESSFAIDEKSEELACHNILGDHKNTVNLIHSFETDNHVYIVLEFCSNGDLYEAIRTGCGPLETEHVRDFMIQLIDAVEYVHSKGMYHRDIKPENIFLMKDGSMKLGDFGLATKDTWSYETTVGSDRYMAPEQYDSAGAGYSPAQADIWAIGIILLNILFSRNPFTTPTEADPLFLDFSRDNQALFDVFADMSQDTFEVILNCMSLDPKKRSLQGARDAIDRVVSFTVSDELEDDYHTISRKPIASANREPLRTPTIKTPQIELSSAFPWAKALHASPPQPIRQLSIIPDTESYTEDLFPKSEESAKDWFSIGAQTSSMASAMNSSVGGSVFSLANSRPMMKRFPYLAPISGSLPINVTKQKAMSSVFGKKEMVSKSWSDMYDEEFEEEEQDHQFSRQAQNARTFSHDEIKLEEDETAAQFSDDEEELVLSTKSSSDVNIKPTVNEVESDQENISDIDGDNVNDGFFFQNSSPASKNSAELYSPPCKRKSNPMDKWAALGARRRAYTGHSAEKGPEIWRGKRSVGMASSATTASSGFGALGVLDYKPAATGNAHKAKDASWLRKDTHHTPIFSRTTAVSYHNRTPAREQENVDYTAKEVYRRDNLGDLEWVGGWGDSVAGLQL
ncbi:RAN protein kinase [Pseudogymnoascus sp. 03VT05]|nr:RAN protein kinase [Pseudogymnoascus sp. 03VT05]